jgi:hypothetical protein
VSLENQAEENWVYQTFQPLGSNSLYLWLGLTDVGQEGVFIWADGSTSDYRNWSPGEPNNFFGGQNYAAIWLPPDPRAPQWDDVVDAQAGALGVVEIEDSGAILDLLVPCDGPVSGGTWKNHGKYVSTVSKVTKQMVQNNVISRRERGQLVSAAARTDCGKKQKK